MASLKLAKFLNRQTRNAEGVWQKLLNPAVTLEMWRRCGLSND